MATWLYMTSSFLHTGSWCSPTLVVCLFIIVGLGPVMCKASVLCVDCSGPGCEHPGSCVTNGKCFLRRDVNGLLYRGCADNQRWEGLDLNYSGCRWQQYLGWDNSRVLWCLCQEANCNSVTVGIFMLRNYTRTVVTKGTVNDDNHTDYAKEIDIDSGADANSDDSNLHGGTTNDDMHSSSDQNKSNRQMQNSRTSNADGSTRTISNDRNINVNVSFSSDSNVDIDIGHIVIKLSDPDSDSDSELGASTVASHSDTQPSQKEADGFTSGKADKGVAGSTSKTNNEPALSGDECYLCKLLTQLTGRVYTRENATQFLDSQRLPDSKSNNNAHRSESFSDDLDGVLQEGIQDGRSTTTMSSLYGILPFEEGNRHSAKDNTDERDNRDNTNVDKDQDVTDHPDETGVNQEGTFIGDTYDGLDIDFEADYADHPENMEDKELASPREGGAKQNIDYRWLVNTNDSALPYEPLGPWGITDGDWGKAYLESISQLNNDSQTGEEPTKIGGNPIVSGIDGEGLQGGIFTGEVKWLEKNGRLEGPQQLGEADVDRNGPASTRDTGGIIVDKMDNGIDVPTVSLDPSEDGALTNQQLNQLATTAPKDPTKRCPVNFKLVQHLHSCYHVDHEARTWQGALNHCTGLDPRAHLVTLDRPGEYQYIVLKVAMQPRLMMGWQGWWTSGRYDNNIREFTWSTSGQVISRLDPRWRTGLLLSPYSGTCVWLVPLASFKMGNYGCLQPAGVICEIDM